MSGKEELAYIAGLFDGEGTVMISRLNCKNRQVKFQYQLRVSIANCNKEILEWVKSVFAGKIYWNNQAKVRNSNGKVKPCYRWAIYDNNAEVFLRAIFPYLKLKRLQAETAFIFRKTIGNRASRLGLFSETQEKRATLRLRMQQLNQKGVA